MARKKRTYAQEQHALAYLFLPGKVSCMQCSYVSPVKGMVKLRSYIFLGELWLQQPFCSLPTRICTRELC